ncbi:Lsb5p [Rhodotorula paludigena]|uniref:Lsb5p n=1 Tax=Rhodotorula paludigena TaxID=86838 RepID=UPI0031735787
MMIGAGKGVLNLLKDSGGLNLGEKPRSSISALIDILCLDKYSEDDLDGVAELVESINLQPTTGPTEASRAIRKKLKYSGVHGQLRALTLLQALVENCGPRFQTTFANERLVDRIKVMAGDPQLEPDVKKKVMRVLASWHYQFKDDPKMQLVAGLYKTCGGGKAAARSAATEAYEAQQKRWEEEQAARAERKAAERRAREEERERAAQEKLDKARRKEQERNAAKSGQQQRQKRPKFNFEQEKPKINAAVGSGTQAAQRLVNALQHVNRESESVTTNARVQQCLEQAKNERKAIIRYIQLIDQDAEGDYIGALISTNEQIIAAVHMYDRMTKPVELDSDDEAVEEAKRVALQEYHAQQGGLSPTSPVNDDTQSIRSRLSAFDMQDRELDKMQSRQRKRLERHLSSRSGVPQVHPDLQDLAFGPSGSSSLPPPIQPRSAEDTYTHGSLSDFSDYSSEDDYSSDESVRAGPSASGTTPARSYAAYVREEDERTGKHKAVEEDPFADPFADSNGAGEYEVLTPGIQDKRMEWKEI